MLKAKNNPIRGEKASIGETDLKALALAIKSWGQELGFQGIGISDVDLSAAEQHLLNWLAQDYHGEMAYMQRHGTRRSRPGDLVSGTIRVISVRMDYLPAAGVAPEDVLANPALAYISRYALGRDYHKVLRKRLQRLAQRIERAIGPFGYRAFADSAPVLEKALAEKAGLGWIGKHSNLINKNAGSWFFLGELYVDVALPVDCHSPAVTHCGSCTACLEICPTNAIVAPYQVDARRCISYHTIELRGSIPVAFRRAIGNRIYGCDDCQIICPWNKFAGASEEQDFTPRHALEAPRLVDLFAWSEAEFLRKTEGSAIRRIGYECWLRNIAVALGNAPYSAQTVTALEKRLDFPSSLVKEHVSWALAEQACKRRVLEA